MTGAARKRRAGLFRSEPPSGRLGFRRSPFCNPTTDVRPLDSSHFWFQVERLCFAAGVKSRFGAQETFRPKVRYAELR